MIYAHFKHNRQPRGIEHLAAPARQQECGEAMTDVKVLPEVLVRCFDSGCHERFGCLRYLDRFSSQARARTRFNPGPNGFCLDRIESAHGKRRFV